MRTIPPLILVVLLSGCASYGSNKYGCKGLPEGVRCTPTRDLYEATHAGEQPTSVHSSQEKNQSSNSKKSKKQNSAQVSAEPITDPVIDTFVTPNLPDRPVPIRTPARVMRIWVASWEDTDTGALIAPGYIYTEIEPRRWVIGKPESAASQQNRIFKPLEQSSSNSSSEK